MNRENKEKRTRRDVRTFGSHKYTLQDSLPTRANHARVRGLSAVAKGNERDIVRIWWCNDCAAFA